MSKRNLILLAALIAFGLAAWWYFGRGPEEKEWANPPADTAKRELVEESSDSIKQEPASEESSERVEEEIEPASMRATVQMSARVVGTVNPKWLLLRVTQTRPSKRIYPTGIGPCASCEADPITGEFNATVQVATEEVLHLGAYSRDGDLLGSISTGRGLESDEVFLWEPVLDLEGLYRDYYFSFHPESAQTFSYPHLDRFEVQTFDAGVNLPIGSTGFDYQVGRVYRMRVPAKRAVLAHLNQFDPGVAAWKIDVGEGQSEQEPELIRVTGRVRVLVPNEIALEASRYHNLGYNAMSDALGVTDSRELEPLPDGFNHELRGLYTGTTNFRLGQRFYRCAFPQGGDYKLDSPAIVEVYSGKLAHLSLRLEPEPGPDTQVFWRVKKDQVQVSGRFSFHEGIGSTSLEVPVGLIRVEARIGIAGKWVSANVDVPRDGISHRLVLPD